MPLRPRLTRRAAAAALLPALAAGCLGGTDVTGNSTQIPQAGLRVVQAVADAQSGVDVALNGQLVLNNATLGTAAPQPPAYAQVTPGSRLAFSDDASGATFFNQVLSSLAVNGSYTAVAYGRIASGGAPAATAAVFADSSVIKAATPGPVAFRVFDALDYVTPGRGTAVDVFVYPSTAARPSTPDLAAVAYGSASPYVTKSQPGTFRVDVFAAGTAGSAAGPLFTTTVQVAAGAVRTLVLVDPPAASGTSAAGSVLVLNDYQ